MYTCPQQPKRSKKYAFSLLKLSIQDSTLSKPSLGNSAASITAALSMALTAQGDRCQMQCVVFRVAPLCFFSPTPKKETMLSRTCGGMIQFLQTHSPQGDMKPDA